MKRVRAKWTMKFLSGTKLGAKIGDKVEVEEVLGEEINEMIQLVIDSKNDKIDSIKGQNAVGNIVLEMRKDLLGKTKLSAKDFTYVDVIDK